jgi:hypothetical protein
MTGAALKWVPTAKVVERSAVDNPVLLDWYANLKC